MKAIERALERALEGDRDSSCKLLELVSAPLPERGNSLLKPVETMRLKQMINSL
jgi:hypothetical protein